MNRRGKAIAVSTATVVVGILLTAGIGGRNRIREGWYIWRLEKGDAEEQMAAAERLGEIRSARAVSALVEAFRMNARKARKSAGHPMKETSLRQDFKRHADLWGQLRKVLMEVGKAATTDLLQGAAREDDVSVAMGMVGALLEIHGYPTSGGHPWSRSRPTYPGELVLRQLGDDLSSSRDTRLLASEVLKKWFSWSAPRMTRPAPR